MASLAYRHQGPDSLITDEAVLAYFQQARPWGLLASIDLYNCDPQRIRSVERLGQFSIELCTFIKMKRYGEPTIVHFGNAEVCGLTLVQLIETSSITAHLIEPTNDGCIDIFSCSQFAPFAAAEFCRQFFAAQLQTVTIAFRGRSYVSVFPQPGPEALT